MDGEQFSDTLCSYLISVGPYPVSSRVLLIVVQGQVTGPGGAFWKRRARGFSSLGPLPEKDASPWKMY